MFDVPEWVVQMVFIEEEEERMQGGGRDESFWGYQQL